MWPPKPLPLPKRRPTLRLLNKPAAMASAVLALRAPCIPPVAAAMLLGMLLAGCDAAAPAPAGGISKGEAEALAEAAEMLDETRSLPDQALPETPAPAMSAPADAQEPAQMADDTAQETGR